MDEELTQDAAVHQVRIFQPGGADPQGETITLSLDDAAQLILQQHSIAGEGESSLQPGTYQILTQQAFNSLGEGQIQLALTDGVNMLHCADPEVLAATGQENQAPGVYLATGDDPASANQILQLSSSGLTLQALQGLTQTSQENVIIEGSQVVSSLTEGDRLHESQSENSLQIDLPVSQSDSLLQVINGTSAASETGLSDTTSTELLAGGLDESIYTQSLLTRSSPHPPAYSMVAAKSHDAILDELRRQQVIKEETENAENIPASDLDPETNDNILPKDTEVTELRVINGIVTETPMKDVEKRPDLNNPIEVEDNMEVVVNGRKCMLKMNPETRQMCAYPILPPVGKKRRGRPRKCEMSRTESPSKKPRLVHSEGEPDDLAPATPDPTDSAAQGLLELSNTGPDGVRRSGRVRKKAKVYEDYEIKIELSDDDAGPEEDQDDPSVTPTEPPKRKPHYDAAFTPTIPIQPLVKRGRGRPRRYPRPGDTVPHPQIPTMIIPSSDGQSIMMAPLQGLTNIQAIQDQFKSLAPILPKSVDSGDEALQYVNALPPAALSVNTVLYNAATGQTIQLLAVDEPECKVENSVEGVMDPSHGNTSIGEQTEDTMDTEGQDTGASPQALDAEELELTQAAANSETGAILNTQHADSLINRSSLAVSPIKLAGIATSTETTQPTIIQIPEDLLPLFMQKRDPVKIGLKASDVELGRLKCPKCGFQAYYEQQYQEHIASHTDDVEKCKCCNFVSFDKEDLLSHFKESHPKCICTVCEHMAEHAYVIKRHMMRHSQEGCKCDICGKVYKDQYVLKMHMKMVHLPAEVLFECTICSKKFTRKAHLKRHLRIHDPEKPFKCPHCTYRGCERSDISKHLLIHEDPKHVCDVCGKAFRHIKNKDLHLKRHNGQRDYKCGVCDFYGYTFTDIRKHIERKHTDVKTVICDKCGSTFRNDQQLRDHKLRQCEVFMIEQALAIATSDGGTSQATLQIPTSLSQQIQIDGQNIALDGDGNVNITVEQISLPGDGMGLTPEQIQAAVTQGQLLESGHVVLPMNDDVSHDVELQIAEEVGHDVVLEMTADDVGRDVALDGVDLSDEEEELEEDEEDEDLDGDVMDETMNGMVTVIR